MKKEIRQQKARLSRREEQGGHSSHHHIFRSPFTTEAYAGNSPSLGEISSFIVPVCEDGEPDR